MQVYAPNAETVTLGDETASDSCGSLLEASPSRFCVESAMPRVQQVNVMATFKGSQVRETFACLRARRRTPGGLFTPLSFHSVDLLCRECSDTSQAAGLLLVATAHSSGGGRDCRSGSILHSIPGS